jgi:hypothetical protein
VSAPRLVTGAAVALLTGLAIGCAKERGEGAETPIPPPAPQFAGGGAAAPPPTGAPPPGAGVPSPTWDAPLRKIRKPKDAPPDGAPAPTSTAATPTNAAATSSAELFRAQDACLDHCDQFACMKIAEAYKSGAGVPADALAGRRYALHACLECGAPGLAIVDQCPAWGIDAGTKKPK